MVVKTGLVFHFKNTLTQHRAASGAGWRGRSSARLNARGSARSWRLDISVALFWSALACQRFVYLRLAAGYWPQDYEMVFRRLWTTNVERNVWFKGADEPAPWKAASSRRTPKRRALR